jgi:hypothetical protein
MWIEADSPAPCGEIGPHRLTITLAGANAAGSAARSGTIPSRAAGARLLERLLTQVAGAQSRLRLLSLSPFLLRVASLRCLVWLKSADPDGPTRSR